MTWLSLAAAFSTVVRLAVFAWPIRAKKTLKGLNIWVGQTPSSLAVDHDVLEVRRKQ